MRGVVFLVAASACSFAHGIPPEQTGSDAAPSDGMIADASRIDAPMADGPASMALLQHDFESDLQGPFTGIYLAANDSVNHGSTAHGGTKSAYCVTANPADAQATLYYNFSLRSQLYASMWVRPASGFPPASYIMIMAFVNQTGPWTNVFSVAIMPDMRVAVYDNASQTDRFSTATLSVNTWHRIEVLVKSSTTAGRVMLAIDGVEQLDVNNLDTGAMQFHRILNGIAWQGDLGDATTLYIDDVRLE